MMTERDEQNLTVLPIIPMKPLAEGKTRLGRQFNQSERADLAAGMLRRVISAIKGASIELFWVIGLPGDLPFIKPSDVINLIRSSGRRNNITLAPARRDGGTNGILVPQGVFFAPELGQRSFAKHLAQAARMEVSVAICYSPGLGFDLDTVDDLETYEKMEPGLLERLVPHWKAGRPSTP
jgi:2-phospho-L-lactate guanylyltransferase (CobY/MobA/RfbA family)